MKPFLPGSQPDPQCNTASGLFTKQPSIDDVFNFSDQLPEPLGRDGVGGFQLLGEKRNFVFFNLKKAVKILAKWINN
jgi:hypothetical protein